VIPLTAAPPDLHPCGWTLLTRPIAPNTIASHLLEVRRELDNDSGERCVSVWVDNQQIAGSIQVGGSSILRIEIVDV
jgi:hypothetical protein